MTERVDRLNAAIVRDGLGAVALMPGANLHYLAGLAMSTSERLTLAFFPHTGQPSMVLPLLETGRVEATAVVPLRLYPWTDEEGADAALARCLGDLGLDGVTLGVEYTAMRVQELRAIEAAAPGLRDVDATTLLAGLRMVKDAEELRLMREAVRIVEAGLHAAMAHIRPGITEIALADAWEQAIREAGAEGLSFAPCVAAGPNSANPHHNNSDRPLQAGDLVVMDGGAFYGGYCSDITRTFAVGEPSPEARAVYEAVLAANAAGRAASRPGASGAAIDAAARSVIEEAGYGEFFPHRTGHGLGLEIHEPPYIVAGNDAPLPLGATFTVEPGVYIAGVGGVRIEDDVVLTAEGAESLTSFPRELIVC